MLFYRRVLLATVALGLAGVVVLAFGIGQWQTSRSDLGWTQRVGDEGEFAHAPATDGRFVAYIASSEERATVRVVDLQGDRVELALDRDSLGAGEPWVSDGRVLLGGRLFDAATGAELDAAWPPGFSPGALGPGVVWGFQDGNVTRLPWAAGATRPWQADPGVPCPSGSFVAAAQDAAVVRCEAGVLLATVESARLRKLPAEPATTVFGGFRPLATLDGAHVLLVPEAPARSVVAYDVATGRQVAAEPIPCEEGCMPIELRAGRGKWAVAVATLPPGALERFDAGLVVGSGPVGQPGATWAAVGAVNGFLLAAVSSQPLGDGLLIHDGQDLIVTHPGRSEFPPMPFVAAGSVLVVAAAAWPFAAPRLLARRAGGGMVQCLNCGKRRDPSLAFCPLCGWRTPVEQKAAQPAVDPWEKER